MQHDAAIRSIAMINEAILRPEIWPDALFSIATCCNATTAHAHMVGAGGYSMLTGRGMEDSLREYFAGGWAERNSRMARGLALTRAGHRGLITERHMFTPEEMTRDPFQNEFAPAYDIDVEAGMVIATNAGSSFVVNIPRSGRRSGSYSDGELEFMNRLVLNLVNACSFALRLKIDSAAGMVDTLSHHDEALALLMPSSQVLHMNAAFMRLLGGRVGVRNGRLHAINPTEDNLLQGLIARTAASEAEPASPVFLRRPNGRPLICRCLPVAGAARDFLGLARIVLAVDDLDQPRSGKTAEMLCAAFRLTPAEARLAMRVGHGEALRDAAGAEDISFETARSRLKVIFLKTDTSRQAELACLVTRLLS